MASLAESLTQVPLFSALSQRQLRRLARDFREREFKAGTTVIREGHMSGVGFFIIAAGEASVTVEGSEVARLGPGDYFGELALISERARTASVVAATQLRCLDITFWDFRRFAKENPDVLWKLLQRVVDLLAEERARRFRAASLSLG